MDIIQIAVGSSTDVRNNKEDKQLDSRTRTGLLAETRHGEQHWSPLLLSLCPNSRGLSSTSTAHNRETRRALSCEVRAPDSQGPNLTLR